MPEMERVVRGFEREAREARMDGYRAGGEK